jgi:hypothetical protein
MTATPHDMIPAGSEWVGLDGARIVAEFVDDTDPPSVFYSQDDRRYRLWADAFLDGRHKRVLKGGDA